MKAEKEHLLHRKLQKIFQSNFSGWWSVLLLFIISALTYLPHITQLNFYRDDWYYIVDGFSGGKGIFHTMFAIDRPARGYLFEWIFQLFGMHPFLYHLSTYVAAIIRINGFVFAAQAVA